MSNVIQFLESLGGRSAPSAAEYAATVALLDINDEQRQALVNRNYAALSELIDGRPRMMAYVSIPNPDDHEAIPDDDTDGDGIPDEDEPPHEE